MFTEYVEKAMHRATYELIEDGTYFGEIPGFAGLWGNGATIDECKADLQGALESWLVLGLWMNDEDIPELDGLSLIPRRTKLALKKKSEAASSARNRKAS